MVTKMLKLLVLACFSAGIVFLSGCEDKDYYDPGKNPSSPVGDNPSTLDFSTSQDVKLNLNYNVPQGTVSVFDVYAQNPIAANGSLRSDIQPIAGGINVAGASELSRVIPSYVSELYVLSPSLFVPQLSYAKIENGTASFAQVEVPVAQEPDTRAGNAGNMWNRPVVKYLKEGKHFYPETTSDHFIYDLIAPDMQQDIPVEVRNAISTTFPEWKKLTKTEFIYQRC